MQVQLSLTRALSVLLLWTAALPAAAIVGTTVDPAGEPFPHVRLELHRLTWRPDRPHAEAELIAATLSDGEGVFRFDGLEADALHRVICPATLEHAAGWLLPVAPGQAPIRVEIPLDYRLALGRLVEPGGEPIAGATVLRRVEQMVPGRGRVVTVVASAETDADGAFALGPLSDAAAVPIEVALPDGTVFRASVESQGIESQEAEPTAVTAPERQRGVIRVVNADGTPAAHVSVRLQQIGAGGGTGAITELIATASGEAVHGGLASGEHRVRLTDGIHTVEGLTIAVSGSESTAEITLSFLGRGSVEGQLLTVEGEPAPQIPVRVTAPRERGTHTAEVLTDAQGRFRIAGLPLGEVTLGFLPGARHGFEGRRNLTVALTQEQPAAVVSELPRVVPVGAWAITGAVRTPAGDPVEGASVRLVPADHERLPSGGGLMAVRADVATVRTDAAGAFTIETELRPDAIAAIWAEDDQGRAGGFDLQSTRAHRWTQEMLESTPLEITLSDTVAVSGQVRGETLNPTDRWEIQLFVNQAQTAWWRARLAEQGQLSQESDTLTGNYPLLATQADEEGRFTITLPRGTPWVAKLASQRMGWTNSVAFTVPAQGPAPVITLGEPEESQVSSDH